VWDLAAALDPRAQTSTLCVQTLMVSLAAGSQLYCASVIVVNVKINEQSADVHMFSSALSSGN